MTWTRNNNVRCDWCGLFCNPVDSYAPFGGTGPEGLDPPEMNHVCKKCWPEYKQRYADGFKRGGVSGDWQKSRAETEAAKDAGLEWVHSQGYVDSRTEKPILYRYIKTSELPYYVPYLKWYEDHPRHYRATTGSDGKGVAANPGTNGKEGDK